MKRFAFILRKTVEQTIWIEADSVKAARAVLGPADDFVGLDTDDSDDERTLSLSFRRDPAQDDI